MAGLIQELGLNAKRKQQLLISTADRARTSARTWAGGNGTTATVTCSNLSACIGCSARQQLMARPNRRRLAGSTDQASAPGEGPAPFTSTTSSCLFLCSTRSMSFAPATAPVALQQMPTPPLQKLRHPGFRLNTAGLRCHPNAISTCPKDSPLFEPIKVSKSLVFRMRSRLKQLVASRCSRAAACFDRPITGECRHGCGQASADRCGLLR